MTEQSPEVTETIGQQQQADPAPQKRSLEDLLSGLDDDARGVVLGEVSKARGEAKNLRDRLHEAEPIVAQWRQLEEVSKTELERATEEMTRWQTEAEKWRSASVGSRIEALAGRDFADPSDAAAALSDHSKYLDSGGQINDQAITADLAAVLERKPHWRRQPETQTPRLPHPSPHQGSGAGGAAPDPAGEFAAILQGHLSP